MTSLLKARGLIKSFGSVNVLNGLDLHVDDGECILLTGANGAGKTTLLRVLAGLTGHDAGQVTMAGVACKKLNEYPREKIGLLTHQPILYDELTVLENLMFYGRLFLVSEVKEKARELIRLIGLESQTDIKAGQLSRGMQQRLSIARIQIHDPQFLFLDEPFTALDGEGTVLLENVIKEKRIAGRAIVITTHEVGKAGKLADRCGMIKNGRIFFFGKDDRDAEYLVNAKHPSRRNSKKSGVH